MLNDFGLRMKMRMLCKLFQMISASFELMNGFSLTKASNISNTKWNSLEWILLDFIEFRASSKSEMAEAQISFYLIVNIEHKKKWDFCWFWWLKRSFWPPISLHQMMSSVKNPKSDCFNYFEWAFEMTFCSVLCVCLCLPETHLSVPTELNIFEMKISCVSSGKALLLQGFSKSIIFKLKIFLCLWMSVHKHRNTFQVFFS